MTVTSEVHRLPPVPGWGAWKSVATYCFPAGLRMIETNSNFYGRDRYDDHTERFSSDNGKTWHSERMVFPTRRNGDDVKRACETFLALDKITGTIFRVYDYGTYQNDSDDLKGILTFSQNCHLLVEMSHDGGKTFPSLVDITGIAEKKYPQYSSPVVSCSHLKVLSNGKLVIPISVLVKKTGSDNRSPKKHSCGCMLLGEWNGRKSKVGWEFGLTIPVYHKDELVDAAEPSVAQLSDGKLLCVIRQDGNTAWNKMFSISNDSGYTWETSHPLCYTNGDVMISPPSCCRLWRHSSGRLFLITNILKQKCSSLQARNALHIIEIDENRLQTKEETLTIIDERKPYESPFTALSNFAVYEDRNTAEICVLCPRAFANQFTEKAYASFNFSDCIGMRYRINVD